MNKKRLTCNVFHCILVWRLVLVKIMTIKLHHKSILIQLQQILWTCCVFLSSLNNTFFSVLAIIFSYKSYFCFNYRNTFFSHAMNYFSVVLRIIFLMCIKNYFLIGPRIIFRGIWSTMRCGPCIWSGLVRVFNFLGRPFWKLIIIIIIIIIITLQVVECFQRECQGETLSGKEFETKEVFIFLTVKSYCRSLSLVMRFSGPKI